MSSKKLYLWSIVKLAGNIFFGCISVHFNLNELKYSSHHLLFLWRKCFISNEIHISPKMLHFCWKNAPSCLDMLHHASRWVTKMYKKKMVESVVCYSIVHSLSMRAAFNTVVVLALKCETYENELSCWIPIIFLMPKLDRRRKTKKTATEENKKNVSKTSKPLASFWRESTKKLHS